MSHDCIINVIFLLELGSLNCDLIAKIDVYAFVIPLVIIHLTDFYIHLS